MRNTTAAGVESAPVLQSASAWVLSRLAVLPARGRMAIRMDTATATATGITRRRPTIRQHRPIMHRGVAGIRITGATTPARLTTLGEAEPRLAERVGDNGQAKHYQPAQSCNQQVGLGAHFCFGS